MSLFFLLIFFNSQKTCNLYSFDVINIVIAKLTNIIGIVISVKTVFVNPNIAKNTVNAEKKVLNFSYILPQNCYLLF